MSSCRATNANWNNALDQRDTALADRDALARKVGELESKLAVAEEVIATAMEWERDRPDNETRLANTVAAYAATLSAPAEPGAREEDEPDLVPMPKAKLSGLFFSRKEAQAIVVLSDVDCPEIYAAAWASLVAKAQRLLAEPDDGEGA